MQIKKIFILTTAIFTSNISFAMFCPGNFTEINPGDSIESVEQKCGKPASEKVTESSPNVPQEWNYFLKLNPADPATIKTSVSFAGGKVVNISVNNVGLTSSGICGSTVQVGDSQETVEAACGKPAFINQNNGPVDKVQPTEAPTKNVNFTYPNGITTTTLEFKNGVLVGTVKDTPSKPKLP